MGHAADGRDRGRAQKIATVGERDGVPRGYLRGDLPAERGGRVRTRRAHAGGGALFLNPLSPFSEPLEPFPINPWKLEPFPEPETLVTAEPCTLNPWLINPGHLIANSWTLDP